MGEPPRAVVMDTYALMAKSCDAITIVIARERSPILLGDKVLQIIAGEEHIKTIW
ncbi:hypothetical protein KEJ13_09930 [Candidatus Bathyarchaeota archaeon]|nr:hypothetical protein [Candidatus Bathyarchaeota archaeon]